MQEMTFEVKSLLGQKQDESLLELHLGTRLSQVLMHWGTVLGHGAEGIGLSTGEIVVTIPEAVAETDDVFVVVVAHLVQIVDQEVSVTVETVLEVVKKVKESEVTVAVTGQVVSVT